MDELEKKYLTEVRDLLSSIDLKILEMLKTKTRDTFITEVREEKGFADPEPTSNFAMPKTGKYQWFRMSNNEGKIRKCENAGCGLWLYWNGSTYEHWKYDINTGKGFYVANICEGDFE